MTTIIPFSNPNQLKGYEFFPVRGDTPEQAEARFHAALPWYNVGVAYWHEPTHTLLIPANYARTMPQEQEATT